MLHGCRLLSAILHFDRILEVSNAVREVKIKVAYLLMVMLEGEARSFIKIVHFNLFSNLFAKV